jgi:RNA polymerase sigma factor (sigma-70 family)
MNGTDATRPSETADVAGFPVGAGVLDGTGMSSAADPAAAGSTAVNLDGLFLRHHGELVRLAVFMVRDLPTAEDVVQDVFTHIHARPNARPRPGHELAYLRASVLNGCRSVYRRRAVAARLGLESSTGPADWTIGGGSGAPDMAGRAEPPPHESAEAEAIRADDCRRVLLALAALSGRRREVLVLRYYLGLSEAEIAATLAISPGSVKSAASRGLAALARKLGEES